MEPLPDCKDPMWTALVVPCVTHSEGAGLAGDKVTVTYLFLGFKRLKLEGAIVPLKPIFSWADQQPFPHPAQSVCQPQDAALQRAACPCPSRSTSAFRILLVTTQKRKRPEENQREGEKGPTSPLLWPERKITPSCPPTVSSQPSQIRAGAPQ